MATPPADTSNRLRGEGGKFIGVKDPPLVDLKVANPVNYLKIWWAKVIGNEGMEFSFRIRPLTAIALALIIAGFGFGVGRITVPKVVSQYIPFFPVETSVPALWKDTAYTGILRYSTTTNKYYLEVGDGENISLKLVPSLDLKSFVGRRILAVGKVNQTDGILTIEEAKDLEVLPSNVIRIPTLVPTPIPTSLSWPKESLEPSL